MQPMGLNNLKRKQIDENNEEPNEAKINEVILTSIEEIYNSVTGDELKSPKEAQSLPD